MTEAVRDLGCSRSTIYSWMKKFSEDGEHALPGSGHMRPDLEHQKRLERENKQLKNEIESLKKQQRTLPGTRGKVRGN